jgi:hypothetical protein
MGQRVRALFMEAPWEQFADPENFNACKIGAIVEAQHAHCIIALVFPQTATIDALNGFVGMSKRLYLFPNSLYRIFNNCQDII